MVAFLYKSVATACILLTASPVMAQSGSKESSKQKQAQLIERGRYLVKIAGCNDCHTPGYMEKAGNVPEHIWLTGDQLGWRGPWGTTYPQNLRLYMNSINEEEWLKRAKTVELRPPMPWFTLRDMTNADLRAIYHYVKHLGPAGDPAPRYLPPGEKPTGPYVQFPSPQK